MLTNRMLTEWWRLICCVAECCCQGGGYSVIWYDQTLPLENNESVSITPPFRQSWSVTFTRKNRTFSGKTPVNRNSSRLRVWYYKNVNKLLCDRFWEWIKRSCHDTHTHTHTAVTHAAQRNLKIRAAHLSIHDPITNPSWIIITVDISEVGNQLINSLRMVSTRTWCG
jgi:hypothetical protein